MGCFWGAEKAFWNIDGVWITAVGYAGGTTPNPTYEEVCSGLTGQNEVVLVVYDPKKLPFDELLRVFWEGHDPTQGMRQGNDVGTQYRSAIYATTPEQIAAAEASRQAYEKRLEAAGYGKITTEIAKAGPFYFAEDYHQQYLAKNPHGYCGHGGTGVSCPIGTARRDLTGVPEPALGFTPAAPRRRCPRRRPASSSSHKSLSGSAGPGSSRRPFGTLGNPARDE